MMSSVVVVSVVVDVDSVVVDVVVGSVVVDVVVGSVVCVVNAASVDVDNASVVVSGTFG